MNYEILINKEHLITEDFVNSLDLVFISKKENNIYISADYSIDRQTLIAWKKLQKSAIHDHVYLIIDDAYRSLEFQQELLEHFIKELGENEARNRVALPKTSEHHTGLAIDYNFYRNGILHEGIELTDKHYEYLWVKNNAYKYGFILRYPKGKEKITGYKFEPWHIRYVGKEVAKFITKHDLTLEDYSELKRKKIK